MTAPANQRRVVPLSRLYTCLYTCKYVCPHVARDIKRFFLFRLLVYSVRLSGISRGLWNNWAIRVTGRRCNRESRKSRKIKNSFRPDARRFAGTIGASVTRRRLFVSLYFTYGEISSPCVPTAVVPLAAKDKAAQRNLSRSHFQFSPFAFYARRTLRSFSRVTKLTAIHLLVSSSFLRLPYPLFKSYLLNVSQFHFPHRGYYPR